MAADDLFLPLPELGRRLRAGTTTSVELTKAALALLERHGPSVNCVAALLPARALREARNADREMAAGKFRGPLHGIPYGAKDLLAAKGAPTEWGSPAYEGQYIDGDAVVVTRLKEAGAVLVAKLAMVSLAGAGGYRYASASITGPGRCPWDRERWSGGSSSGSGAAVAAGLVPFAIGSETWGSIVVPSAFCGVTGLRPTYGRIPRTGAMALSWTLDKLGPMARSAEDASLVLAAIAGPDADDPSSMAGTYRHPVRTRRRLRVGVLPEDWKNGDTHIQKAWDRAVKDLERAGCVVRDARLPEEPWSLVAATIVVAEGSASFENVARGPRIAKLGDVSQRAGLVAGLAVTASDYLHALRLRPRLHHALKGVFNEFDALVAPSLTKVAPPVEANLDTWFAGSGTLQAAGNAVGIPCVAVPMGFGESYLPCGFQVAAPWGREADAVSIACSYQGVTRWHTMRPKEYGG